MKPFKGNTEPTLGVEQEFHLIDTETGELANAADTIADSLPPDLRHLFDHELHYSVCEMKSDVFTTPSALVEHLRKIRQALARICQPLGLSIAAAGSHPFSSWRQQQIVDSDHYHWVQQQCGYLVRRMLGYGLHIHVGMVSAEAALYAMQELRRWGYLLMAWAANSPFYQGDITGLQSTRCHLFGSMPRATLGPEIETMSELQRCFARLQQAGDITAPGDLWWWIRPQPPLGTLELRLFDLPTNIERIGILAALTQALAVHYQQRYQAGLARTDLSRTYLDQNRWQAMQKGLAGNFVDAATGQVKPARTFLAEMIEMLTETLDKLDTIKYAEQALTLAQAGTEADWQLEFYHNHNKDLRQLELEIAQRTRAS